MPIKFLYDLEHGLKIDADKADAELTEQQAMIVAVRDLGAALSSLSRAVTKAPPKPNTRKKRTKRRSSAS